MRQAVAGLLAAVFFGSGCAYSLVTADGLREPQFGSVVDRTAQVRGIPRPAKVATRTLTRDELPALLERIAAEDWTRADIADYQDALTAIGVWPADRDLLEESLAVSRDEVAGLYVPSDHALYVVRDARFPFSLRLLSALMRRDLAREAVLAHEVVHLLQHTVEPELLEQDLAWKTQDDATSALQAAIEGDATRYGLAAVLPDDASLPDARTFREGVEAEPGGDTLARAPALLRLTLVFPYAHGYGLSLREDHQLLTAPPVSTEQVLHPGRRRADFAVLDLAPLRDPLPETCRLLGENTLGELGISVLLRDLGQEPEPAAWQGWDGDRYLAARCGDRREFLWWTHWDSEPDAAEFEAAYRAVAPAVAERAGLAAPPRVVRLDRRVIAVTPRLEPLSADVPLLEAGRVATLPELREHFAGSGAPR
jgi:hypothetical protein